MKKVLFVATVVKLHIMVFHLPYLEWFKKNGYEVHVAARNDYARPEDCVIPFCDRFIDLPFERSPLKKANVQVYHQLRHVIESEDYTIIHCHTPMGGALGRLAARQARKRGTQVIYTAHGFHFYHGAPWLNWALYYPSERLLSRWTDLLITINDEDTQAARHFKAKRLVKVPGVGIPESSSVTPFDRSALRASIGITDQDIVVLAVGELNPNKNHRVLIDAIAQLDDPRIHLVLCGEGALKADLQEQALRRGLSSRVHLLGFRSDVTHWIRSAEVFGFPSKREGLSLSLMEAMAGGLPVVASKIRGNTDLIDEQGGILVSSTDVAGFSEALRAITGDLNHAKALGHYNAAKIDAYRISRVLPLVAELYQSCETASNRMKQHD